MEAIMKQKRIKGIMRLLDPQKVKASIAIMLIIIIVSGAVLLSAYLQARTQMEQTSKDLIVKRVSENSKLLDRNLRNFQQTLYTLAVDNDLFWFKNWSDYTDIKKLQLYYNASKRIRNVEVPDISILDIYACFPSQNLILADGIYAMDDYPVVLYPTDKYPILSSSQWENLSTNDLNFFVDSSGGEDGRVEITNVLLAYKMGYDVNTTGFVVMRLDARSITDILYGSDGLGAESVYVADPAGRVVYTGGSLTLSQWQEMNDATAGLASGMAKLDSRTYFFVEDTISINGWTYRMAVPKDSLISGQRFNTSMILIIAVLLIMALAFGMLGAQVAFQPLERLYQLVSRRSGRTDQSDRSVYLSRVFDRIFNENNDLRAMAQRNLPVLQEKALMQMVMQPHSDARRDSVSDNLGIRFDEPYLRIAVISYHLNTSGVSFPVEMLQVEIFNEFWNDRLGKVGTCRMVLFEPQRFFIVINYSDAQRDGDFWRSWFNQQVREFREEFHCDVTGGISPVKTSVNELGGAFLEALRTFERQLIVGPGFVEIHEKQARFGELQLLYPFEKLQKLMNVLRTSDTSQARRILSEIHDFIRDNPPRNEFALRQIFLSMSGTLRQLLLEIDDEGQVDRIDRDMSDMILARGIDGHMEAFTALTGHIQAAYIGYASSRRRTLLEQIKDYIRENYQQLLTPEELAAKFYISTTYLYRIMKNEGGTSPYHYLTGVRVEKAEQLLGDSDMTVSEISARCGFESERSFYRNFRSVHGCTPTQYRNACAKNDKPGK